MTLRLPDFSVRTTTLFPALALIALALAFSGCTPPSADDQDKNWTTADRLVDTSDRVITAQFIEERLVTIEGDVPASGVRPEPTIVLFRQFEVSRTFKGTTDPEDRLWVAFEPGAAGELVNSDGDVETFQTGTPYVLFLKGRLRPLEYPTDYGPVLWTGNGEPSFAELQGDRLIFRAERAYLDLLEREDEPVSSPPSAAPFDLALTGLESMTR